MGVRNETEHIGTRTFHTEFIVRPGPGMVTILYARHLSLQALSGVHLTDNAQLSRGKPIPYLSGSTLPYAMPPISNPYDMHDPRKEILDDRHSLHPSSFEGQRHRFLRSFSSLLS